MNAARQSSIIWPPDNIMCFCWIFNASGPFSGTWISLHSSRKYVTRFSDSVSLHNASPYITVVKDCESHFVCILACHVRLNPLWNCRNGQLWWALSCNYSLIYQTMAYHFHVFSTWTFRFLKILMTPHC